MISVQSVVGFCLLLFPCLYLSALIKSYILFYFIELNIELNRGLRAFSSFARFANPFVLFYDITSFAESTAAGIQADTVF